MEGIGPSSAAERVDPYSVPIRRPRVASRSGRPQAALWAEENRDASGRYVYALPAYAEQPRDLLGADHSVCHLLFRTYYCRSSIPTGSCPSLQSSWGLEIALACRRLPRASSANSTHHGLGELGAVRSRRSLRHCRRSHAGRGRRSAHSPRHASRAFPVSRASCLRPSRARWAFRAMACPPDSGRSPSPRQASEAWRCILQ